LQWRGRGNVTVWSSDPSDPTFVLRSVKGPMKLPEMIRKATQWEKQRSGLRYREDL